MNDAQCFQVGLLHDRRERLLGDPARLAGPQSQSSRAADPREAARLLRRYLWARVRAASLPPSYTSIRDTSCLRAIGAGTWLLDGVQQQLFYMSNRMTIAARWNHDRR